MSISSEKREFTSNNKKAVSDRELTEPVGGVDRTLNDSQEGVDHPVLLIELDQSLF